MTTITNMKRVPEIPVEIVEEFIKNTEGAGSDYYGKIRKAEVKIGVFAGQKMVGFIVGRVWGKILIADAPYVKKEFRGKEIGSRMLYRIFAEAKKLGFEKVQVENTTLEFDKMAGRAIGKLKEKGIKSVTHTYNVEETMEYWWEFFLHKKKVDNTPRKLPRHPKPPNRPR